MWYSCHIFKNMNINTLNVQKSRSAPPYVKHQPPNLQAPIFTTSWLASFEASEVHKGGIRNGRSLEDWRLVHLQITHLERKMIFQTSM